MRDPDQQGVGEWKAWLAAKSDDPKHKAVLSAYLVYCPKAHAFWSYWGLSVVHLRSIEGVPEADKITPEMTHEILFAALHPELGGRDPDKILEWVFLQSYDLVKQFQVPSDQDAVQMLATLVRVIMSGRVSPDSDFKRWWSKSIDATAACVRAGKHPIH